MMHTQNALTFLVALFISLQTVAAPSCPAGSAQPPGAASSPRLEHFRAVLAKGEQATLGELLQFWSPEKHPSIAAPESLVRCQVAPWGALVTNGRGDLTQSCKPDVLYSWGPAEKLQTMKTTLANGQRWKGSPNPASSSGVWATLSPVATFNYGPVPVRIKLKKNVKFRNLDQTEVASDIVMYEPRRGMNDFLIDHAESIESWSYGTADHYDEIVEDTIRLAQGDNGAGYALRAPRGEGFARIMSVTVTERALATEASLKKSLLEMIRMIVNDEGRVQYARGVCPDQETHFQKRF